MAAASSKEAAAYLIDPFTAPEPSAETGPGSHFGSTFAPATSSSSGPSTTTPTTKIHSRESSLSSNNPFRQSLDGQRPSHRNVTPPGKSGVAASQRSVNGNARGSSPREDFPAYRAEAFADYKDTSRRRTASNGPPPPSYNAATSQHSSPRHRRRTSSLKQRYPGDKSTEPLDVIRRDSKKADRSPHLNKRHLPGADLVDKLDPAIGGHAYHHEGPFDAALLARNTSYNSSPLAALKSSNAEALKATPQENIQDAIERHKPLDGVAAVPPGEPDRFGRTYDYEEGTDVMREDNNDGPGYKRWAGKDYDPDDLKGQAEPSFSLDRALRAHKIDDDGIEMAEGTNLTKEYNRAQRNGTLDTRDPVKIAGDEGKYADLQHANAKDNDAGLGRSGSLRNGLKKRIGSLRHRKRADS